MYQQMKCVQQVCSGSCGPNGRACEYSSRLQDILQVQYNIETALLESVVRNATVKGVGRLHDLLSMQEAVLHSDVETKLVLRRFYEELFVLASNCMLSMLSVQLIPMFEEGRELYMSVVFNRKVLYEHNKKLVRCIEEFDEVGACAALRGQLLRMGTYYSVYLN
ncbi:FCD domain-containing protein [Halodesulfovibrio marinisediminis]|uniref:FCD domain-containing protein n=1 Tax=Halodesulfovibrio marinisediminis DSM 17456 TaxID=1121457 RepID=A0A1N6IY35_9BACT|nr:FCD domain-containing protein [Halodesulfovibrio marinisediminis]SIO36915.1 FCD domain-containing protein [Halodesulfovibrio marinisediminis DSM 17456]